ncbi:MAG TPA: NfeD family protein [Anaeromyxobacteraceae bacterium]|nr:NfeD family protein [Anaeromyxobacteraceae bacterium]
MAWWWWVLFGVVLLGVELLTPGGLFALFLGISALAVGVLVALGAGGPDWLQWGLFSLLSIALLAFVRRRLRGVLAARTPPVASVVGEVAILTTDLPPRGVGRAELHGSTWEARSLEEGGLAQGRRCRVERVEGLTLWVRPE